MDGSDSVSLTWVRALNETRWRTRPLEAFRDTFFHWVYQKFGGGSIPKT